MPTNATSVLDSAETTREQITDHRRNGAEWFHDHEGELFDCEDNDFTIKRNTEFGDV